MSSELSADRRPGRGTKLQPLENKPKMTSSDNFNNINLKPIEEDDNLVNTQKNMLSQREKAGSKTNISINNDKKDNEDEKKSQNIVKKKQISDGRRLAKKIMGSRGVNNILIFLIVLYVILIFSTVALQDLLTAEELEKMFWLLYIEIIILSLFQIEIILTAYGQGVKQYFRDNWLLFDAAVILISMALVIIDILIDFGTQFSSISSVVRGIFRFLRIFLLIRKMQTIKKIKTTSMIQTPAERIIDLLGEIRELFETQDIIQDIDWSMEVIGSNKLYDPIYSNNQENGEGNEWIEFGATNRRDENQDTQDASKSYKKQRHPHQKKRKSDKVLAIIPEKVLDMFRNVDELSYDCWDMKTSSKGQELKYLMLYIFDNNDLFQDLEINTTIFSNFITKIQESYHINPYHCCLHAFDVTQTTNFFLKKLEFEDIAELSIIDLASIYIAAACHDVDHPGYQNIYLINIKHPLAIQYNDIGVLENHHVSFAFNLLNTEELDFTANWSNEDFKRFRELMISIILSTDMAKHFTDIAKMKARLGSRNIKECCNIFLAEFDIREKNDKLMCIDSIVHAADISNPIKEWGPCFKWTEVVLAEFWRQGDSEAELGIPVSYLCDRYTTNMAKSQGGFINFVVKPIYELIVNFLPLLQPYMQNFTDNNERWNKLIPEYDEKLKILVEQRDENVEQQD